MSNSEQHEMLCAALSKCVEVLDCDELALLAHCCGVRIEDFYGPMTNDVADLFIKQARLAA